MTNKFLRFLTGLKFAIALLVVIAVYSIIGTLLPQGLADEFYLQKYPAAGNLIILLQFNGVYQSYIYRGLLLLFMVNLIGCTLNILPARIRRLSEDYFPAPGSKDSPMSGTDFDSDRLKKELFKRKFKVKDTAEGFMAIKHRVGYLGSSVTHLGIVIIVFASFIGSFFAQEGFFNILPGESKAFLEHGFTLKLEDFELAFREDGTVDQYYSTFTIYEEGQKVKEKTIWVNNPLSHNKMEFFQSSYGWASNLQVKNKEGEILHKGYLKDGDSYFYQPQHLSFYLFGFFPDFAIDHSGQPLTKSQHLNNPYYAVVLYHFSDYLDSYVVEPDQTIMYEDIEFVLSEPRLYTGITYRQDFGYTFVMVGSGILIFGLLLSFYFYPKCIYVKADAVTPVARQNRWGLEMQVKNMLETIKSK